MSSVMLETHGNSFKVSSIFLWNLFPAATAVNGNLAYLYCQIGMQKFLDIMTSYPTGGCDIQD